jgi:hypothetical protein
MKKEKRTARELADLIMAHINVGGVHVTAHADPVYGWHRTVVASLSQVINCHCGRIAREV